MDWIYLCKTLLSQSSYWFCSVVVITFGSDSADIRIAVRLRAGPIVILVFLFLFVVFFTWTYYQMKSSTYEVVVRVDYLNLGSISVLALSILDIQPLSVLFPLYSVGLTTWPSRRVGVPWVRSLQQVSSQSLKLYVARPQVANLGIVHSLSHNRHDT